MSLPAVTDFVFVLCLPDRLPVHLDSVRPSPVRRLVAFGLRNLGRRRHLAVRKHCRFGRIRLESRIRLCRSPLGRRAETRKRGGGYASLASTAPTLVAFAGQSSAPRFAAGQRCPFPRSWPRLSTHPTDFACRWRRGSHTDVGVRQTQTRPEHP